MPWVCRICGTNNPDDEGTCFICDAECPCEKVEKPVSTQQTTTATTDETAKSTASVKVSSSTTETTRRREAGKSSSSTRSTDTTSTATETTRRRGAGTRSRTSERRISRGSTSAAMSREERLREEMRVLKLQESLINARSAITFAVVFASVICGLTKQLKNWAVFEWIVGIGCGAILLFWAICICANSIGYFKIKPKEWLCLPLLGVGLALNSTLYLAVGSAFLVPYLWWAVYAVVGGILSMRHLKGKDTITFGISIAEMALAVLLIALPWIV